MSIDEHDKRRIRCRMLGHEVGFCYCRQVSGDQLCRKILDCWFEIFDVRQFLEDNYSPEQIEHLLEPPKPKVTSILELIREAQSHKKPPQSS